MVVLGAALWVIGRVGDALSADEDSDSDSDADSSDKDTGDDNRGNGPKAWPR